MEKARSGRSDKTGLEENRTTDGRADPDERYPIRGWQGKGELRIVEKTELIGCLGEAFVHGPERCA